MQKKDRDLTANLPINCSVIEVIDNCGQFERVYKCPDGSIHYIPESLLFSSEVA